MKKLLFPAAATAVLLAAGLFAFFTFRPVQDSTEPLSRTTLQLNTVITVTLYDTKDDSLLDGCVQLADHYEKIFSRTDQESELYQLNHRLLPPVEGAPSTWKVSEDLADLLSRGLKYSEQSSGAFDIAIAPLTSLWNFTGDDPQVPDEQKIQTAVSSCGYEDVTIKDQYITLPSPDTAFDLGGIAKGYIADKMKEYLVSHGVKSGVINLGGNVLCIGNKPDGTPFLVGIQKPFAGRNETIATVNISGRSVVSSGIYERYFEKDGSLYHHILDPETGYPYDNDLVAVTVICDQSVDGDALSTTGFALGYEKGKKFIESCDNVQAVFITKDYKVHYTDGFQDKVEITEPSP